VTWTEELADALAEAEAATRKRKKEGEVRNLSLSEKILRQ
jgi:hypothetical protein